tara:strand:+ start:105 stop:209 length:105 start_codon:yes stop_codon:yes gene_type:complete
MALAEVVVVVLGVGVEVALTGVEEEEVDNGVCSW